VEEHNIVGGLGGAVAEYLAEQSNAPRLLRVGIPDTYGHGGMYKDLLEEYGLTREKIAEKIKEHR
jgi:transketolase